MNAVKVVFYFLKKLSDVESNKYFKDCWNEAEFQGYEIETRLAKMIMSLGKDKLDNNTKFIRFLRNAKL